MVGNVIDSRFLRVVDYPTAAVLSVVLMVSILVLVAAYIRRAGAEELV
jgi:spermidine/putrescine transport system permease protein